MSPGGNTFFMFEVIQHRFLVFLATYPVLGTVGWSLQHFCPDWNCSSNIGWMYMNFGQSFIVLIGWILLTLMIFWRILSHHHQVKVFTYVSKYLQCVNIHSPRWMTPTDFSSNATIMLSSSPENEFARLNETPWWWMILPSSTTSTSNFIVIQWIITTCTWWIDTKQFQTFVVPRYTYQDTSCLHQFLDDFGSDWNILVTIWWTIVKCGRNMHVPLRMNHRDVDEPFSASTTKRLTISIQSELPQQLCKQSCSLHYE